MFKEVDSKQETFILEEAERSKKKGPDFSIRTVTHWMTLQHHSAFCTVPSHYDNVPATDFNGEPYDKYPSRMCVDIEGYSVCRHCFIAEGDSIARMEQIPPVERTEGNSAPS